MTSNSGTPTFFLASGDLFNQAKLTATLPLSGLQAALNKVAVNVNGTATLTVPFDINLTGDLDAPTAQNLSTGSLNASVPNGGSVDLQANLTAQVLGISLVQWGADLKWSIDTQGNVTNPTVGANQITTTPQFLADKTTVAKALVQNLLPDDPFGLKQLGIDLQPLAQLAQYTNTIDGLLGNLSDMDTGGSDLNPTNTAAMVDQAPPITNDLTIADASTLLQFVEGQQVDLVTYTVPDTPIGDPIHIDPTIPLGVYSVGFVTLIPSLEGSIDFQASYRLKAGIDSNGIYLGASQADTGFTLTAAAGPSINLQVLAGPIPVANGKLGATFSTSADLTLNSQQAVSVTDQNGQADTRLYVAAADQSVSNLNLGDWLSDAIQLTTTTSGSIVLSFEVQTPAGAVLGPLNEGELGKVAKFVENDPAIQGTYNKLKQGWDATINGLKNTPVVGPVVSFFDKHSDQASQAVQAYYLGDYLPILNAVTQQLGIIPPDVHTVPEDQVPALDVNVLGAQSPPGSGTYPNRGIFNGQEAGIDTTGLYTWVFPLFNDSSNPAQVQNASQLHTPHSSSGGPAQPSDLIQYSYDAGTGVLTIQGTADENDVQLIDAGNGQVELTRSTTLGTGTTHNDLVQTFPAVNKVIVDLGGGDNSLWVAPTLSFPVQFTAGNGANTVTTAGGDDTITLGDGDNNVSTGDGNDQITAGKGNDTIDGGAGSDTIMVGDGNCYLSTGTGAHDVIHAGNGSDTLLGGDGADILQAGNGANLIVGGSGDGTQLITGTGKSVLVAGTGQEILKGGGNTVFYWKDGDNGNDVFMGGGGQSLLLAIGSDTGNRFVLGANGSHVSLTGNTSHPLNLDMVGMPQVLLDGGATASQFTINDLSGTDVTAVGLSLDNTDTVNNRVTVNGSDQSETLGLTDNQGVLDLKGFSAEVLMGGSAVEAQQLNINGKGGDDQLTVDLSTGNYIPAGGIRFDGGSGTNSLAVVGDNLLAGTYAPSPFVRSAGTMTVVSSPISFSNLAATTVSAMSAFTYTGADTDNVVTLASPTTGEDQVADTTSGQALVPLNFTGVGNFTLNTGAGRDSVTIKGPAATGLSRLTVNTGAGDDTLTVDSSNGLFTPSDGIHYDGGDGFDSLVLSQTGGGTQDSDKVVIGPTNDAGGSLITGPGGTQAIAFAHIEPLTDTVPATTFTLSSAPGIASLLQGSNNIAYTASQLIANGGRVTVDNFEPVEFSNKNNLVLDTGTGTDTVTLNNSTVPAGLQTISVAAADPNAANKLVVDGTTSADAISYQPTDTGSGSLTIIGLPPVSFTNMATVTLNGQGGGDNLTVEAPAGTDTITYNPGDAADSGSVLVGSLVPLTFSNLGVGAANGVTLSGNGTSSLLLNGTSQDDTFTVDTTTGKTTVTSVLPLGGKVTHLPITPTGISSMTFDGLDGHNTVIYNGAPSQAYTLQPAGTRVELVHSVGNPVNIDLNTSDVSRIDLNVKTGVNSLYVADLSNTSVTQVNLDLDWRGGASNNVVVNAPASATSLDVVASGNSVSVLGMHYVVQLTDAAPTLDTLNVNGAGANRLRGEAGVQQVVDLSLVGGTGDDTFSGYGRFYGGPARNTYDGSSPGTGVLVDLDSHAVQYLDPYGNYVQLLGTFDNYIGTATRDDVTVSPLPGDRTVTSSAIPDLVRIDTRGLIGVLTPNRVWLDGIGTLSFSPSAWLNVQGNGLLSVSPQVASVDMVGKPHYSHSHHRIRMQVQVHNLSQLYLSGPFVLEVTLFSKKVKLANATTSTSRLQPLGSSVIVFTPNSGEQRLNPNQTLTVDLNFHTRTGRLPKFALGLYEGPGNL